MVGAWWPEITKNRYLGAPRPEVGKIDIFFPPEKKTWKNNGYPGKARNGKKNDIFSKISIFYSFFTFSAFPKNIHVFSISFLGAVGNIYFPFFGDRKNIVIFSSILA